MNYIDQLYVCLVSAVVCSTLPSFLCVCVCVSESYLSARKNLQYVSLALDDNA